jgi:hypothetical protein
MLRQHRSPILLLVIVTATVLWASNYGCNTKPSSFCRLVVKINKNKIYDSVLVISDFERVAALKASKQMKIGFYKLLLPVRENQLSRVCLVGKNDTLCSEDYLFKKGEYYEFESFEDSIFLIEKE